MKLYVTVQDRDTFTVSNYTIDEQSINYQFDNQNLIGSGNKLLIIQPPNTNFCYYFTISVRAVPRKVDNITVNVVYYFMVSCKNVSQDRTGSGLLITNFQFEHTTGVSNIGSITVFDNYPIVLQSGDIISSSIEVTYRLTDTIVYG